MSEQALPTLLLVHGAWHGAWCWEQQFAPWLREQGHDVVTMDLPGHGKPGPERIEWFSLTDYADAVEAKLRGLGRPVIVAGHSMGGMVVQKLMERRPANLAAHQGEGDQAARIVGAMNMLRDAHTPENDRRLGIRIEACHVTNDIGLNAANRRHFLR